MRDPTKPNSLLKPNRERCDNPEFSCSVLRFFHGFSSAIFICIFLWNLELHLTVEINLSHIPKQWEIGVFMKWTKREVAVWEVCETGRTTDISSRKFWWSGKAWPCSLLLRMMFFRFVKPIRFPGRSQDDLSRERIRILVFAPRFLGSPRDKRCNLLGGNVWRKVVSTSK